MKIDPSRSEAEIVHSSDTSLLKRILTIHADKHAPTPVHRERINLDDLWQTNRFAADGA
jgi:hypothetical protein